MDQESACGQRSGKNHEKGGKKSMLKTVKRLAAVCLAAVIAMGFVPALNAEAATLKKPEN